MSGSGLMLLFCTVMSAVLNIYYIKPVWEKLKTKRAAHFRFAFWLIGSTGLVVCLMIECWRLGLKDLFV